MNLYRAVPGLGLFKFGFLFRFGSSGFFSQRLMPMLGVAILTSISKTPSSYRSYPFIWIQLNGCFRWLANWNLIRANDASKVNFLLYNYVVSVNWLGNGGISVYENNVRILGRKYTRSQIHTHTHVHRAAVKSRDSSEWNFCRSQLDGEYGKW